MFDLLKKYNLLFIFILIIFSFYFFFTKDFIQINGDTSNFIDYFWRLKNGQVPHQDFRSPFGPTLKLLFNIGDFLNNNLFLQKFNILESFLISKLLFSVFIFILSFCLIVEFLGNKKLNIYLSIILSLYISSYYLTSRAFGYFSLQSLTSFYNSLIISSFFLIIIFVLYLIIKIDFKNKSIINSYILSFIFGFIVSFLIHLKISAIIISLPLLLIFFFFININHIRYNFYYFLFGIFFYILIIISLIGVKAYFFYIIENYNYLKITLDQDLTQNVRLSEKYTIAALYNSLKDLLILVLCLFVLIRVNNKKFEFILISKIKILVLIFSYFLVSYVLQITSVQYPESGVGEFVLLAFVLLIIIQKINIINKILCSLLLVGPAIISYKNILIPISFFFYSTYGISISTNQDKEYYKNYASYNFLEKIINTEKQFIVGKNLDEIKSNLTTYYQLYDSPKLSHIGCSVPISYITKTTPPKNSNLFWHYGVNFKNNIHNVDVKNETNIFFDCENSYSSNVNLKRHFNKKISFSDKVNIWLK